MKFFKAQPQFDREPGAKGALAIAVLMAALLIAGVILITKGLL